MTVKELIEKLSKFTPDSEVLVEEEEVYEWTRLKTVYSGVCDVRWRGSRVVIIPY